MIDKRKLLQGLGAVSVLFGLSPAAFARSAGFERAVGIIGGVAERALVGDVKGDTYEVSDLCLVCDHFAGNITARQLHTVPLYTFDLMLQADARLKSLNMRDEVRHAAFSHVATQLRGRGICRCEFDTFSETGRH